ncbi:MAG: cation:dicarboxylase symporter family transporter, partial [Anaerobutyricum sp.]|nr:cation:dicarboxylase symporter family transporter [Anaerobutyricum sp.]
MTEKKEKNTIVKRMMISVVAGFVVGFLCLMIKSHLVGTDSENVWNIIDAIFFQDITATTSIEGIGLFYIIGQLFMHALQMMIVPLVLCSLSLALCSLADPKRLGKIAGKTFVTYLSFYVVAAALAAAGAYFVKTMGWFDVHLPNQQAQELVTMEGYNPLVTVVNAVPSNIISAMSTNSSILSVCVFAIIVGLGLTHMGEKGDFLKKVLENMNDIVQMFLNFLINKTAPVAIFCMITRALAVYGIEYIAPTLVWIAATIVISLLLVCTIYPIGIFLSTGLNPI